MFVFLIIVLPIKIGTSLVMFIPLASVLITMLLTGEGFTKTGWKQLGFHRFPVKLIFFATIIPMIPIFIGYVIVWLTGLGTFELAKEYEDARYFYLLGFSLHS